MYAPGRPRSLCIPTQSLRLDRPQYLESSQCRPLPPIAVAWSSDVEYDALRSLPPSPRPFLRCFSGASLLCVAVVLYVGCASQFVCLDTKHRNVNAIRHIFSISSPPTTFELLSSQPRFRTWKRHSGMNLKEHVLEELVRILTLMCFGSCGFRVVTDCNGTA